MEGSDSDVRDDEEPWGEFLSYLAAAFGLGAIFGLSVFLANKDAGANVAWGSYADWVAAGAGLVGASSGIAIALIARGELARRKADAKAVAVASANWAIAADLEMTVRLTRATHRPEADKEKCLMTLARSALTFETPDAIADLSLVSPLPSDIVGKIALYKGMMKLSAYTGGSIITGLESGKGFNETDWLFVANMELLASKLLPVATYLRQQAKSVVPAPWENWAPVLDARAMQTERMRVYHETQ